MQLPTAGEYHHDAVVTHAARDAELASRLLDALRSDGRRVAACDDAGGSDHPDRTAALLGGARRVLGLLSRPYLEGWWNRDGAALLWELPDRSLRLIPLLCTAERPFDVPSGFRARPALELVPDDAGELPAAQLDAVRSVVGADHADLETTVVQLHRWFDGDLGALEDLLGENLSWMQAFVRKHLTPGLRRRFDSMDVVQDGALRILRYSPKHPPKNRAQLRALFKKTLLDALRDRIDHLRANRRNIDLEESLPAASTNELQPLGRDSVDRPDAAAERQEMREWVKLALEFLDPLERSIVLRREYHRDGFESIATDLGLASPDAARMRYNRALPKLAAKIRELRRARRQRGPDDDDFVF